MKADEFFVVAGEEKGAEVLYALRQVAGELAPTGRRCAASRSPTRATQAERTRQGRAGDRQFLRTVLVVGGEPRHGGRAGDVEPHLARYRESRAGEPDRPAGAVERTAESNVKTPPSAPEATATGLVVAPGQALTAIGAADCANPTVDGKAAKSLRADAATGLMLFAGDFGAGAQPPSYGAGSASFSCSASSRARRRARPRSKRALRRRCRPARGARRFSRR